MHPPASRRFPAIPAIAAACLLLGCVFETAPAPVPLDLRPEIPGGVGSMYAYREFRKASDGTPGDTALRFIRYSSPGDTQIAGVTWRLLVEEDLAFYNADQGLVLNRVAFAVRWDGDTLRANQLRMTANIAGRLPLKAAAGFDTAHFEDETAVLVDGAAKGRAWELRPEGHPSGHPRAAKAWRGLEEISRGGFIGSAFAFEVSVKGMEHVRIREWYSPERKLFARTAYAIRPGSPDSNLTEEEYVGMRGFTSFDTAEVLRSAAAIRGTP